jgi:FixJ family two-component response regulator
MNPEATDTLLRAGRGVRAGATQLKLRSTNRNGCTSALSPTDFVAAAKPIVLIVDDSPEIRESLQALLRSVGLESKAMGSLPQVSSFARPAGPACLVLDVRLPGRSGLDFQRELSAADVSVPIIFMTAHGDVPMSVQAMKAGAIEFLIKPFRDQDLLDAIQVGLAHDRVRLERDLDLGALRERYDTLTAREREVLGHVVKGSINKQIANDLGISEMTVKVHRGNLIRKMRANSLPDLARMADRFSAPLLK